MPRSKQRKHHHDQQTPLNLVKSGKSRSAEKVAIIFFALLGLGIAFFAAGTSVLWLAIGAIAGAVAGYFFGKQIDRSFSKK
jgi:hypothetical protein